MKILLVIGLLFSTLFAADFRGEGWVKLNGGNTVIGDTWGNTSQRVPLGL